ncbi:unnamed protein product, partial [Prorocentrum cordatum]
EPGAQYPADAGPSPEGSHPRGSHGEAAHPVAQALDDGPGRSHQEPGDSEEDGDQGQLQEEPAIIGRPQGGGARRALPVRRHARGRRVSGLRGRGGLPYRRGVQERHQSRPLAAGDTAEGRLLLRRALALR